MLNSPLKSMLKVRNPFHSQRVLCKGESLSATLFNLDLGTYLENNGVRGINVDKETDILDLEYADDSTFISDTADGIKKILRLLKNYCHCNYLNINAKKSKIVEFKRSGRKTKEVLQETGDRMCLYLSIFRYPTLLIFHFY